MKPQTEGLVATGLNSVPDGVEGKLMTPAQRAIIHGHFDRLEIRTAKHQFEAILGLTGLRIASIGEVTAAQANTIIRTLAARNGKPHQSPTGNVWVDREEETWIDRL